MLRKLISGSLTGLALMSLILLPPGVRATESDVGKEQRWADQVIEGLLDGDEVWLNDGNGHEFLGILTEGEQPIVR